MCIKGVKNMQINVRFSKYVVMFILLNKIVAFVAKFCQKNLFIFPIYMYVYLQIFSSKPWLSSIPKEKKNSCLHCCKQGYRVDYVLFFWKFNLSQFLTPCRLQHRTQIDGDNFLFLFFKLFGDRECDGDNLKVLNRDNTPLHLRLSDTKNRVIVLKIFFVLIYFSGSHVIVVFLIIL